MSKLNIKNYILKSGAHYLTSDFKTRNKNRRSHNGMDFVGSNGVDDIIAIETGKVSYVGYDKSGGGYWISIKTNGIEHRYFHLSKGSINVKKGIVVNKGDVIATMGKSGNATNYCLHFSIFKNRRYVDPLPYLINDDPFVLNKNNFKEFVYELKKAFGIQIDEITNEEILLNTKTISTLINWNHSAVKILQKYLVSLGYDLGIHGIDGKYGSDMKKVIMNYQKNVVGLKNNYIDGVITARMYTWKKILKLI